VRTLLRVTGSTCAPHVPLHLRSSVHPLPPAHHLDPTTPSRGSSLSPPRRLGTHSARPLDSSEKITREWVYDVVLDQMVGALEAHGPDAPQAKMVEAPEAPEGDEAVEGVEEAEAAEEAEQEAELDALSTSLADSDLGRRIALALADSGGTGYLCVNKAVFVFSLTLSLSSYFRGVRLPRIRRNFLYTPVYLFDLY
jgi:hypothetical protein